MSEQNPILKVVMMILIGIVGVLMSFPFYWMFLSSLKTLREIFSFPPSFIVFHPQWINYVRAWYSMPFAKYFFNTLVMALAIVFLQLIISCLAAYSYSKMHFFGRNLFFYATVACLVVPPQIRFVPLYLFFSKLGMLNTYWALILPFGGSAFSIFFIRQAFMIVSDELIDEAKIEGANVLQIIWHIMVPVSKGTLITLALFSFIYHWNDYFWPLVMTNTDAVRTLPVGLAILRDASEGIPEWNILMASNAIVVGPLLVLFAFVQKSIMRALTISPFK